jgi:UDP-GlcNAc3NAcA epimerase
MTNLLKIVTIVGARPQFIKAATVSRILRSHSNVSETLVHTGQHYDRNMSKVFFDELEMPKPEYNLGIGSGNHGMQTGRMIEAIEQVLLTEKPNFLMVYGDTNSTLAGAIAASKLHIPIAHVEAGLRSFDNQMPEEINRILTDRISTLLFAPTTTAVNHLKNEGINDASIYLVGDVMYDAALYYQQKAESLSNIINKLNLQPNNYILVTIHRAENTDNPEILANIFNSLINLSQEICIVLPLHPRTRKMLANIGLLDIVSRTLILIEPVSYFDMILLEKNAKLIATDSGGIQKEAYFYQVPCVTLRDRTEWIELVEIGGNTLVSTKSSSNIITQIQQALLNSVQPINKLIYGDGTAASQIVDILCNV